jgi:hypothetical protein
MPIMRKLAVLGVAAEAARRYARKNPDKAREITDKAASFVDQRTHGRFTGQIGSVKRQLAEYVGYAAPEPVTGATVITPAEPLSTPSTAPTAAPAEATRPTPPTPYKRS